MSSKEFERRLSLECVVEQLRGASSSRMRPEDRKELVTSVFKALKEEFINVGGEYVDDMNVLAHKFGSESLLVRRENPELVISALRKREPIEIKMKADVPGERYANASAWKGDLGSRGLETAFLEGHGQLGGIVTVLGFSAGDSLNVEMLSSDTKLTHGTDRRLIRSIDGRIDRRDVRFVILRIPGAFFPEDEMTDAELEKLDEADELPKGWPVFRAFVFSRDESLKNAA